MNQSSYSPDTFGTYLSNPDRKVSGIDLSSASVLEVLAILEEEHSFRTM